jgi:GH25 family lysozyme M1 (1,4-beta-N-acetylmuramidase)
MTTPTTVHPNYEARIMDVAHMDKFDAVAAKNGTATIPPLHGVILKACQGTDAPDPKFMSRWVASTNAGLWVSAYQFGTNLHSGEEQWADFKGRLDAACALTHRDPKTVRCWMDRESNGDKSIMSADKVRAWLAAGRAAGYLVGVYGGLSQMVGTYNTATDPVGDYDAWVAAYDYTWEGINAHPPKAWAGKHTPWFKMFQYSDGAAHHALATQWKLSYEVAGCGTPDLSVFVGTTEEARVYFCGA